MGSLAVRDRGEKDPDKGSDGTRKHGAEGSASPEPHRSREARPAVRGWSTTYLVLQLQHLLPVLLQLLAGQSDNLLELLLQHCLAVADSLQLCLQSLDPLLPGRTGRGISLWASRQHVTGTHVPPCRAALPHPPRQPADRLTGTSPRTSLPRQHPVTPPQWAHVNNSQNNSSS